jgi:AmmeMemoRadiSam system protein A
MSPRSETSSVACVAPQEFTAEERALLLDAAHQTILSAIQRMPSSMGAPSAHLSEPRGVFTTLYFRRALRGCVGYPTPGVPLYRAVIETARGAAFEDPRFPPVTLAEAQELRISLSVLSPLQAVSAEAVEAGNHGLVISEGPRRGLLLPQVAAEHGWDRLTFLEQTCRKAGLPLDAWRKGARIEVFTAEVFGDDK